MKKFVWKGSWMYNNIFIVSDNNHLFRLLVIDFIIIKRYPVIWIKDCVENCFPHLIDTLNKILILL